MTLTPSIKADYSCGGAEWVGVGRKACPRESRELWVSRTRSHFLNLRNGGALIAGQVRCRWPFGLSQLDPAIGPQAGIVQQRQSATGCLDSDLKRNFQVGFMKRKHNDKPEVNLPRFPQLRKGGALLPAQVPAHELKEAAPTRWLEAFDEGISRRQREIEHCAALFVVQVTALALAAGKADVALR